MGHTFSVFAVMGMVSAETKAELPVHRFISRKKGSRKLRLSGASSPLTSLMM
jgi:hypothetical protein